MMAYRVAHAIDRLSSSDTNSRDENVGDLAFQFVRSPQCSSSLLREIGDFLDSQDTSHPFQWPQWSGEGGHMALLRRKGRLFWLAHCGTFFPAGRVVRPIRALSLNRGPVCDDVADLEIGLCALLEEARRLKFAYIEIGPEWTGPFADSAAELLRRSGWQVLPSRRSSLRLGLSANLDDLISSFRKTTRHEIRRSIEEGVQIIGAGTEAQYDDFLRLYGEMSSERGFPAEKPKFLISLFRWLAEDRGRGRLLLALEAGDLQGGVLIVRSGARCWYILGATSKRSKLSVGHLLQWRAIEWAKENGCLEYDFGGFREGANSGPALFKKGFCDNVVHFIPAHKYVISATRERTSEFISKVRQSLPPFGS
jgi:GNAT acetyltransferase-like protein